MKLWVRFLCPETRTSWWPVASMAINLRTVERHRANRSHTHRRQLSVTRQTTAALTDSSLKANHFVIQATRHTTADLSTIY
jgi:hypothetical protein